MNKNKRIGIIVRSMVIKSLTSGINNAIIGWIDMFKELGYQVDLITDSNAYHEIYNGLDIDIIIPNSPLTYTSHSEIFQFEDAFNYERCLNFRGALINALSSHLYDTIICNEPESAFVCYQMQLYDKMNIIYFTHEPGTFFHDKKSKLHIYKESYLDLIQQMLKWPITIGIPTRKNIEDWLGNSSGNYRVELLPLPLTSKELIRDDKVEERNKDGVFCSGRIEDRKNSEFLVKTMSAVRDKYGKEIKINILTKESHVKKAEALFKKYNYSNYEIKTNLLDKEKFEFIESSRIGFYPAQQETFGLSAFESLRFHPTLFLKEYEWYKNFETGYDNFILSSKDTIIDDIWSWHEQNVTMNLAKQNFIDYYTDCVSKWQKQLEVDSKIEYTKSKSNKFLDFLNTDPELWMDIKDIFKFGNVKNSIYLTSDIEVMYKHKDKYQIKQTPKITYVGITPKESIKSFDVDNSFFQF